LKRSMKQSMKRSPSKSPRGCTKQHSEKYANRTSPPYPANECCNELKLGNDDLYYKSVRNSSGICRWKKVKHGE